VRLREREAPRDRGAVIGRRGQSSTRSRKEQTPFAAAPQTASFHPTLRSSKTTPNAHHRDVRIRSGEHPDAQQRELVVGGSRINHRGTKAQLSAERSLAGRSSRVPGRARRGKSPSARMALRVSSLARSARCSRFRPVCVRARARARGTALASERAPPEFHWTETSVRWGSRRSRNHVCSSGLGALDCPLRPIRALRARDASRSRRRSRGDREAGAGQSRS